MSHTQILLALDDSKWSAAASVVAIGLTQVIDDSSLAALHVVNVVTASGNFIRDLPGRMGFEPAVVAPDVEEAASDHGRRILGTFKLDAQRVGVETRTTMEKGSVGERIVHHAESSDLLVMGARGETETRFPGQGGSTVAHIMSEASVPVLVVPENGNPVGSVLLAYDGSEGARHAVAAVRRFFSGTSVVVHAVFVALDGVQSSVLDELDSALTGCVVHRHVVQAESVREGLERALESTGADLIALGFRGKNTLKDFVFGSTSEYLAMAGGTMVLVTH